MADIEHQSEKCVDALRIKSNVRDTIQILGFTADTSNSDRLTDKHAATLHPLRYNTAQHCNDFCGHEAYLVARILNSGNKTRITHAK